MATELTFDAVRLPPECQTLRQEVRAFLAKEVEAGTFDPHGAGIDGAYSEEVSRKVGVERSAGPACRCLVAHRPGPRAAPRPDAARAD